MDAQAIVQRLTEAQRVITSRIKNDLVETPDQLFPLIAITLVLIFVISRLFKLVGGLKAVGYLPGFRPPLDPYIPPGVLLPSSWLNPRNYYFWNRRFGVYEYFKSETVSVVPWLFGTPTITTSNMDVIRQVIAGGYPKNDFIKPEFARKPLQLWGMNILTADGDLWRKHRRILGSTFTNSLYRFIWEKILHTYSEILEAEGWDKKNVVEIPSIQAYTFKITLLTIARCGFGFDFDWKDPPKATDGSMSIQKALRVVADRYLMASLLPSWVLNLPIESLRELQQAKDQMTSFIREQIKVRREVVNAGTKPLDRNKGKDCFTAFVEANEDEGSKNSLDEDELVGNAWTLLFTGNETTAHTLSATFAHLAVHPAIQQEVYEQIVSVIGYDRKPTFEEFPKLDKVLALFYEVLRLYPSGYLIYREAAVDTTLKVPNFVGQEGSRTIPVAAGTRINIDLGGVQYSPRYFDNPHEFRPSRWYGVSDVSETFIGFGVGPRACIGRRFSLFEAVCLLTQVIRDWKVEPLLQSGQTLDDWKAKTFNVTLLILLGIKNVPVKLVRRRPLML